MCLDNSDFQIQLEDSYKTLISKEDVNSSRLKLNLNEIVIFCGAGISLETPTNMPNILGEIIQIAIDQLVNEKNDNQKGNSTLENPKDISPMLDIMKQFRFEHFVEILSNYDKELICLNYLKEPPPNQNHFFLAELLNKHNVPLITTNLDSCIEKAFKILNENLKPTILINKEDFENFNGNKHNSPKKIICKLHGSVENYFEPNIRTKESYGTTIKDFLKVWKEDKLIFLLPSYKKKCLKKIVNNKWLIFIGYSGQDTFDIEETMINLKPKGIIWFQFYNTNEKIYDVKPLGKITRNFDEHTFQNRRYVDPNNRFREIRKFYYLSAQKKKRIPTYLALSNEPISLFKKLLKWKDNNTQKIKMENEFISYREWLINQNLLNLDFTTLFFEYLRDITFIIGVISLDWVPLFSFLRDLYKNDKNAIPEKFRNEIAYNINSLIVSTQYEEFKLPLTNDDKNKSGQNNIDEKVILESMNNLQELNLHDLLVKLIRIGKFFRSINRFMSLENFIKDCRYKELAIKLIKESNLPDNFYIIPEFAIHEIKVCEFKKKYNSIKNGNNQNEEDIIKIYYIFDIFWKFLGRFILNLY